MRIIILAGFRMAVLMHVASSQLKTVSVKQPVAKKLPKVDRPHGDIRVDEYHWLRDKNNPEVLAYLETENRYFEEVMKPTEGLQETIYREILGHTKETDLSAPYALGGYWYYTRTEEGKQYPTYCRKRGGMDAQEQITLDLNELARGHKFLGLGLYWVSDDGNFLAYSLDTTGFREYRLYFRDLRTGALLPDSIGQVSSGVWAADNRTFFYVKEDHAKRPYRLYRHVLGKEEDDLLSEEKDELYHLWTYRSSDRQFIFLASTSAETADARYLRSEQPLGAFKVLLPREVAHKYYVDHREDLFYVRTNKDAKNFRLITAPDTDPQPNNWRELLPHRPAVKLEGMNLFKNYGVFSERENGLMKFRVLEFRTRKSQVIEFSEPVYAASSGENPEFDTKAFRFNYESFITPNSVFDYDMEQRKQTLVKETEVPGGYDRTENQSERLYAKASDGTRIPISLVHKKGTKRDGTNPLVLYGYGSYGVSMLPTFSVPRLSLLNRGVIYAIAHIRGGGEMGEGWHDDGKMMKKRNTFTDFIACAEHVIEEKYTSKERLAVQGASAGGMLIGAILNFRSDLFKVAHLAVPFVDVINTMLDESLPLTVAEFLEWGNPKNKDEYDYIKTYCPYTNIEAKAYPAILVTTAFNDSQVMYWESAKYVAKMRSTKEDNNPLLLKTNMDAGHGGASGRYDAFKEQALILTFLLTQLGITK